MVANEIELTNDLSVLERWVGRSESDVVMIDRAHVKQVAATLGAAPLVDGDELPPLWHWCFGNETAPTAALGPDGHPPRGGFLPPVALPRRMWAGGRVWFALPVRVGDTLTRTSTVASVRIKQGSSGLLIFVTTSYRYENEAGPLVTEERDLVYRAAPAPGATAPAPTPAAASSRWHHRILPTETLLFRYSAVTFNSHRIHYDYPYATGVEGYRGLVVHGPLTATLLADFAQTSVGERLGTFTYRSQAPLIAPEPFTLHGEPDESDAGVQLWVAGATGALSMSAHATFGSSVPSR